MPIRVIVSMPATSATSRSRPDAPSRSAIASAGGITSGVTWVSVERWVSHMVTAVMRKPLSIVAPASERRSPPITLDSRDCASADASAATCAVSSPCPPATAQASASSRRLLPLSLTCSGRSSYFSEAAKSARTCVASFAMAVSRASLTGAVPPAAEGHRIGIAGRVEADSAATAIDQATQQGWRRALGSGAAVNHNKG